MNLSAAISPATVEQAVGLGLQPAEFDRIVEVLGRTPNYTELCVYSVMWSEPCSYKNAIGLLKELPRKGESILEGAGHENLGIVDIGDGIGCVFRMEARNQISAAHPFAGAASCVGDINREIFATGARPLVQLNSLRFGMPDNPQTAKVLDGVVRGIGESAQALGVPVMGGEVFFDEGYQNHPLVNSMSVGLVDAERIIPGRAKGVGNPVFVLGYVSGGNAKTLSSGAEVSSGDPLLQKVLLEAVMELTETDAIDALHDIGSAGIVYSTSRMCVPEVNGMDVYLDRLPVLHDVNGPDEILLSGFQSGMLIALHKGKEEELRRIAEKWDLTAAEIGVVTKGTGLRYFMNDKVLADVPVSTLTIGDGVSLYTREIRKPKGDQKAQKFTIGQTEEPKDLVVVARQLIAHPNIASKRWIYEQFDSMVGTANMSVNQPGDAAVVNLKGTNKALALSVDCNARYVSNDPEKGTMIAVAEAARNITCSGGEPLAVTHCFNFGDPSDPEVYGQLAGALKGLSAACAAFGTPVTGGDVSFNPSVSQGKNPKSPMLPAPVIGMVGLMKDKSLLTTLGFKYKGDLIYLLGPPQEDINSSEYLVSFHGVKHSPAPWFDMNEEVKLQQCMRALIRNNYISAAHDVSKGGLFTALVEMGLPSSLGFDIVTDSEIRRDAFLFGESQSRIVVTVVEDYEEEFLDYVGEAGVQMILLGHVTKGRLTVDDLNFGSVEDYRELYERSIEKELEF